MNRLHNEFLLLGAGAGIFVLLSIALLLHVPGSIWVGTLARKDAVIALMAGAALLYGGAVATVLHRDLPKRAVWIVLAIAVLLRVVLIASPPFMSSDVYRYVWDGRVQAAGQNPYAYVPADPALAGLRDDSIYPRINRAEYAPTIYPPMAQLIFAAAGRISQTVTAMKIGLVLIEAAGIFSVMALLQLAALPESRVLIYAWNPLAVWSVAGDGHVDGAMIGLLGVALLLRAVRRDGWAGAVLGAAALTKFLPLAVAPALWRRFGLRMPGFCVAVILALYAVYASVGLKVFGFLQGYTAEEGLAGGSGFWLPGLLQRTVGLPPYAGVIYVALGMSLLGAVALRMAFLQDESADRGRDAIRVAGNVAILAAGTMILLSPHYPWYYPWLALPCCLQPFRSVLFLSVAPLLLYCDPFHDEIVFPTLVFVPTLVLAAVDWRRLQPTMAVRGAA